jgi:class 3 adenylate cyclase
MALPDYPLENQIERINIFKLSYNFIIFVVVFFACFDFIFLGEFPLLHLFNAGKIFVLVLLHPFLKPLNISKAEDIQVKVALAILIGLPVNLGFALGNKEWLQEQNLPIIKDTFYYLLQYSVVLLLISSCLRLKFLQSGIISVLYGLCYFFMLLYHKSLIVIGNQDTQYFLFQCSILILTPTVGFGMTYFIDKYIKNQISLIDRTEFWKNYSENLLKQLLPKTKLGQPHLPVTYYLQSICLLYLDITGIANYFRAKQTLIGLDGFLSQLFSECKEFCLEHKIEEHEEDGKYWFLVLDHPTGANLEYADPLANLALHLQKRFQIICSENRLKLDLRMGMASGKYVDYATDAQKIDIFYINKSFEDADAMEKHGVNGEIQVTAATFELLKERFRFAKRGPIALNKNKADATSDLYLLQDKM